ncbi:MULTISPECIES: DUF2752 domain-containing protein [Mycolicibacterium]|uniref:Protein of uncharacterized function (DUF2752) n=1 Tax=Mycolicibacterium senegalense TaxID=1796 RepID=A0A378T459_9MYCO|nr:MULTISPECIES: DUF2752 domain-containing protein [Mycolicibacterium]MCV7334920.1 DUF2752 domain-containing protein [Mycolicibacterium senegalense]MDR7289991.1 hypothetical protein [Mycolicibacterium senegalense]QZA26770.1 DUF2752 domain-containing protein [Mycolicibacterium senegalense]CDP82427.1 hypothetical protein BN975_00423 [Mycolicibacterium farcinogenes]STZ54653.1 Protein of uncharacterised function (DUF2752) [Mycolicibacterium senegalense]
MERSAFSDTTAGRLSLVTAGVLGAGALAYIGLADPHRPGFLFPECPFKALTGWNCPGCGGLRMTHDLLHGDVGAAIVDNVFALVGLPALLVWMLVRRRQGKTLFPWPAVVTIAAAVMIWTVVRNVPGFPLVPTLTAQ